MSGLLSMVRTWSNFARSEMRHGAQPGVRADAPVRGSLFAYVSAARRSTDTLGALSHWPR